MTTAKKNIKKFILQGEHDKGENMAKGITVIIINGYEEKSSNENETIKDNILYNSIKSLH